MLRVLDKESRTIGGSFVSDSEISRFDWSRWEPIILSFDVSSKAADTTRVENRVAPFLLNHSSREDIGGITSVSFADGVGSFEAIIDDGEEGDTQLSKIESRGAGISMGATILEMEEIEPAEYEKSDSTYSGFALVKPARVRATKWELFEISKVAIPAFNNVGGANLSVDENKTKEQFEAIENERPGHIYLGQGTWATFESIKGSALERESKTPKLVKPKPFKEVEAKLGKNLIDESKMEELKNANEALQSEVDNLKNAAKLADESLEKQGESLTNLESENARLSAENDQLKSDMAKTRHEAKLSAQVQELFNKATVLQSELKLNKDEFESLFDGGVDAMVQRLAQDENAVVELAKLEGRLEGMATRQPAIRSTQQLAKATEVAPVETVEKTVELSDDRIAKAKARMAQKTANISGV